MMSFMVQMSSGNRRQAMCTPTKLERPRTLYHHRHWPLKLERRIATAQQLIHRKIFAILNQSTCTTWSAELPLTLQGIPPSIPPATFITILTMYHEYAIPQRRQLCTSFKGQTDSCNQTHWLKPGVIDTGHFRLEILEYENHDTDLPFLTQYEH